MSGAMAIVIAYLWVAGALVSAALAARATGEAWVAWRVLVAAGTNGALRLLARARLRTHAIRATTQAVQVAAVTVILLSSALRPERALSAPATFFLLLLVAAEALKVGDTVSDARDARQLRAYIEPVEVPDAPDPD